VTLVPLSLFSFTVDLKLDGELEDVFDEESDWKFDDDVFDLNSDEDPIGVSELNSNSELLLLAVMDSRLLLNEWRTKNKISIFNDNNKSISYLFKDCY
jgi:hypothetical protein